MNTFENAWTLMERAYLEAPQYDEDEDFEEEYEEEYEDERELEFIFGEDNE